MLITDKINDDCDQLSSLLNTACICESAVFIKADIPTYAERSQKMHENSLVWKGGTRWWVVHGFLRRPVVVVNLTGRTAEVLDPGLFGEEKINSYILGQAM